MTIVISGVSRDSAFAGALGSLLTGSFASRLFERDATLWGEAAAAEAAVRLGWTDFAAAAEHVLAEAEQLAGEFAAAGVDRIVLCGMGGSSLAPLLIAPGLTVLDSTHPDAVRASLEGDLRRTAVVVSSKSGGTVETLSHLAAFEAAFLGAGIDAAARIVVVTDPGSQLEASAKASGKRVFLADPTVGGRFSALTAFGIVPSVLAGTDMRGIVSDAAAVRASLMTDSAENPALELAAAIAAGLPERFVLEMHPDGSLPAEFGLWIEQLVAESTGKDGKGVLPIALPLRAAATPSGSVVSLTYGATENVTDAALNRSSGSAGRSSDAPTPSLCVAGTLGEQLLLWQVVTAALGFLLSVDPFNQPDVESAKIATRESLGGPVAEAGPTLSPATVRAELTAATPPTGYVAIQAYCDPSTGTVAALLEELRAALNTELGVPVSLGYGPRYLHSTGQFHKGGPNRAAFLQLVARPDRDVEIPGEQQSFGELLNAQARGDASVLQARGRTVIRVETDSIEAYLRELLAAW